MRKRTAEKHNNKDTKSFIALGGLFIIILAEIASDMGNAIVAAFNLSGIAEATLWLLIVGIISATISIKEKEVI